MSLLVMIYLYFLFLSDLELEDCIFLGIYQCFLSPIFLHIILHSNLLWFLHFCNISCNFSFMSDFICLCLLSFFLNESAKDLSILFIFSKNKLLVLLIFLLRCGLYFTSFHSKRQAIMPQKSKSLTWGLALLPELLLQLLQ